VAEVRAFRAIRYDDRVAGPLSDLICPPYDVITPAERAGLVARNERNFVRVELPEEGAAGYAQAAELFHAWMHERALAADTPSVYVHEHEFALGGVRAVRRGVFVALRLHEPSEGVVLPHERTFPKAKADRLELLRATRVNTSAIFAMVDGGPLALLRDASSAPAGEARVGMDSHRLSRLIDTQKVARFRDAMRRERVYIADGHHRYETALTYANEVGAGPDANERFVLTYVCALDDPGLRILATHRLVAGGHAALDAAIARSFVATPIELEAVERTQPGIVLVRDGTFTRLELRADADRSALPAAWRELPVAIAEEFLLREVRETDAVVTYEHDAERAIAAATGESAILLRAVDPSTLRAVADSGERLPQKTTYFYPKVPAGLVIRSLDLG
jgi:uncharacterized protein (DUF1015 family)